MNNNIRVLVTGCSGLIGSHLVDILLYNNFEVHGIDNFSYSSKKNLNNAFDNKNFIFYNSDVKNINKDFKDIKFDFIFHLASMKKPWGGVVKSNLVIDENYFMTREVIEYSIKNKSKLIFTSTSDVYGNSEAFLENEKITIGPPTNERYSYAMSKLISEQLIFNSISQSNLKSTVIRIFGCVSSRSNPLWSAGHVPLFVYNALHDKEILIHGDGEQTRSISHAGDIAEGLFLVIKNFEKTNSEIINLGTDQQTTVKEVALYILNQIKSKSKINFIERKKIFGDYDEILVRYANTKKAKDLLNFKIKTNTFKAIDEIIYEYSNKESIHCQLQVKSNLTNEKG